MLSFGSAAYTAQKELVGTFSANLETLSGAAADPKTMQWWEQQSDAWAACRRNLETPEVAMPRYVAWLKTLPGKTVFVGYPAGFDFLFVYGYLMRFAGESPFSFSALDIKTYAMAILKKDYRPDQRATPLRHCSPYEGLNVPIHFRGLLMDDPMRIFGYPLDGQSRYVRLQIVEILCRQSRILLIYMTSLGTRIRACAVSRSNSLSEAPIRASSVPCKTGDAPRMLAALASRTGRRYPI